MPASCPRCLRPVPDEADPEGIPVRPTTLSPWAPFALALLLSVGLLYEAGNALRTPLPDPALRKLLIWLASALALGGFAWSVHRLRYAPMDLPEIDNGMPRVCPVCEYRAAR